MKPALPPAVGSAEEPDKATAAFRAEALKAVWRFRTRTVRLKPVLVTALIVAGFVLLTSILVKR